MNVLKSVRGALGALALFATIVGSVSTSSAQACPPERRGLPQSSDAAAQRIKYKADLQHPWVYDVLGCPVTGYILLPEPQRAPPGSPPEAYYGALVHFEHGSIYTGPHFSMPAYEVHGAIRDKWAEFGWEHGLGYPTSDELDIGDGRRMSHFEWGVVTWSPWTGAHAVHGRIGEFYRQYEGWAYGGVYLGLPTSDEFPANPHVCPTWDGRQQNFENAVVCWTRSTNEVSLAAP